ncbi:MAG: hypothetical protein MZV65_16770 [Chromatiales bacterium]|nr:hypothetical protein [Chromatiales bacterium]
MKELGYGKGYRYAHDEAGGYRRRRDATCRTACRRSGWYRPDRARAGVAHRASGWRELRELDEAAKLGAAEHEGRSGQCTVWVAVVRSLAADARLGDCAGHGCAAGGGPRQRAAPRTSTLGAMPLAGRGFRRRSPAASNVLGRLAPWASLFVLLVDAAGRLKAADGAPELRDRRARSASAAFRISVETFDLSRRRYGVPLAAWRAEPGRCVLGADGRRGVIVTTAHLAGTTRARSGVGLRS